MVITKLTLLHDLSPFPMLFVQRNSNFWIATLKAKGNDGKFTKYVNIICGNRAICDGLE